MSNDLRTSHLLVLSAASADELETATAALTARLKADPGLDLAEVATDLAQREAGAHRRALVCRDAADAAEALEAGDAKRIKTGVADAGGRPVAFMCSGQGAQYAGMGRGLYQSEPVYREQIDRCCEALDPHLGLDLRSLLFPADGEAETAAATLEQTQNTQPALFVVEYANARLWMHWGVEPAAMIGHSIGEYAAACLAGVLPLDAALALVAARGRMMQSLPPGDMLTVPLDEAVLEEHLADVEDVSVATINAPGRSVVSGPGPAIEAFSQKLKAQRVRARLLHTSHAFHSAMMEPILEPFTAEVAKVDLEAPKIPYVSNVTGTWITDEEATDPSYYATHLRRAVRFADGAGALLEEPRRVLLEVGPGNTLTTLTRRHPAKGEHHMSVASIRHPRSKDTDDVAFAFDALAELWLAGVEIDWGRVYPT